MAITLRAPRDITNISLHGNTLECVNGLVHVAEEDVAALTPHGFTLDDPPALNALQRSEILRMVAQEARIIAESWSNEQLKAFLIASKEKRADALSAVAPPKKRDAKQMALTASRKC